MWIANWSSIMHWKVCYRLIDFSTICLYPALTPGIFLWPLSILLQVSSFDRSVCPESIGILEYQLISQPSDTTQGSA